MNNCDTCRWWEKLTGDQGGCRRGPPQVTVRVAATYASQEALDLTAVVLFESSFPNTKGTDWCGAWDHDPRRPFDPGPPPSRPPPPTMENGKPYDPHAKPWWRWW